MADNVDTFMSGRERVNEVAIALVGISKEFNDQKNTLMAVRLLELSVELLGGGREMFEGFRNEMSDMNEEFDETLKIFNKN